MEGKDNRSIDKRKKMRQLKTRFHGRAGNNVSQSSSTPSSYQPRGVADVADSSDDRFVQVRERWSQSQQDRHYALDELDLLDELDSPQEAQMRAGDFTQMLQMNSATGGHFKFSSEKDWDNAANTDGVDLLKNTEASEYFTLNLKLLSAGLRTIPFHKRMEYPSSIFTNQEILSIEKAAEDAEKEYQDVLQSAGFNPQIDVTKSSAKSDRTQSAAPADGSNADVNNVANETEKLNLEEKTADDAAASTAPVNNNSEIQDWLDNVLDEEN